MKAELEKELASLSFEEKNEVFNFLLPFVTPDAEEISPELLAELDRRMDEDDRYPERAISLETFKSRWAHRL